MSTDSKDLRILAEEVSEEVLQAATHKVARIQYPHKRYTQLEIVREKERLGENIGRKMRITWKEEMDATGYIPTHEEVGYACRVELKTGYFYYIVAIVDSVNEYGRPVLTREKRVRVDSAMFEYLPDEPLDAAGRHFREVYEMKLDNKRKMLAGKHISEEDLLIVRRKADLETAKTLVKNMEKALADAKKQRAMAEELLANAMADYMRKSEDKEKAKKELEEL